MQKIYLLLFVALLSLGIASCKKRLSFTPSGTSSFTIVNGLSGSDYLYTNFNGDKSNDQYYVSMRMINYGYSRFFNSYIGQQDLGLYPATDTNGKALLRLGLDLELNSIHTLFLTGTIQDPDYVLTTDQLPHQPPADSTMGLRFINISKGSDPVSVNLAGQANGSEVGELPYKSVSAFKTYKAGLAVSSYTFEFRDKASGTLLGSCVVDGINNDGSINAPNIRRGRNYTIALMAVPGGSAAGRVLIIDEAAQI
ncbi:MAG: hypothetical protein J0H74_20565 [Chitinophagaceae bacterium]|nr:hypothetical protein [Chitinophagaceae bacterium]